MVRNLGTAIQLFEQDHLYLLQGGSSAAKGSKFRAFYIDLKDGYGGQVRQNISESRGLHLNLTPAALRRSQGDGGLSEMPVPDCRLNMESRTISQRTFDDGRIFHAVQRQMFTQGHSGIRHHLHSDNTSCRADTAHRGHGEESNVGACIHDNVSRTEVPVQCLEDPEFSTRHYVVEVVGPGAKTKNPDPLDLGRQIRKQDWITPNVEVTGRIAERGAA